MRGGLAVDAAGPGLRKLPPVHAHDEPSLTHGHYVWVTDAPNHISASVRYRVIRFAVPGVNIADHGWVTAEGNPGRTYHPR